MKHTSRRDPELVELRSNTYAHGLDHNRYAHGLDHKRYKPNYTYSGVVTFSFFFFSFQYGK